MSFIVVIPARYYSSRLPGKPLIDIGGKPMVRHVVDRARESLATRVVVATDDERILKYCDQENIEALMTSSSHVSGTDRIEEVSHKLQLEPSDIVVNVQGDEPLIPPSVINQVAMNLDFYPKAGICTLYENIPDLESAKNPNVVKVVTDSEGYAMYFSRSLIPFPRDIKELQDFDGIMLPQNCWKRHIGIYAYRVQVLYDFVTWPEGELEKLEKLEQLRAMENGTVIHAEACTMTIPTGVDTHEDLDEVRSIYAATNPGSRHETSIPTQVPTTGQA